MIKSFALFASIALATPSLAQSTLVLNPCQDGLNGAASQTAEELGKFLQGTWQMSAAGTGFTTGVNKMAVSLRFDEASGTLRMEGGGPSVALQPLTFKSLI